MVWQSCLFSTSTWRTDLVCFPYVQHIIANISMSTASSKIFRDHVKFHLPKNIHCQHFHLKIPSSKIFMANISYVKIPTLRFCFFSGNKAENVAGDFSPGLLEHQWWSDDMGDLGGWRMTGLLLIKCIYYGNPRFLHFLGVIIYNLYVFIFRGYSFYIWRWWWW